MRRLTARMADATVAISICVMYTRWLTSSPPSQMTHLADRNLVEAWNKKPMLG
jgi:hypothetical protein